MRASLVLLIFLASAQLAFAADKTTDSSSSMFAPLPENADDLRFPITPEKVALGKKLFFEKALSKDYDISCNSCHDLAKYGVDGEATSPGHKNQRGERNSPTVYNSALHAAQFWDGREPTVEAQALGPILNPVEMALSSGDQAVGRVKSIAEYRTLFKKAFPNDSNPITFENIGLAIGSFERTLVTPSKFDLFLNGKEGALTAKEKEGLKMFVETGCVACHSGQLLGGKGYFKLGLVVPYETKDMGLYNVTKKESDRFVFKVPSLRNISKTGPYFHDGSIPTIEGAVRLMARHQLGRELGEKDVEKIVTFLNSLTGEIPGEFRK